MANSLNLPFRVFGLQQSQIWIPFVANHFAARKTTNRYDHFGCMMVIFKI